MEVRGINNKNNMMGSFCAENAPKSGVNFRGKLRPKAVRNSLKWISENFSSPQQRAVLGITALCTQPFIDLYNRHIKKEDKPITVARTIAKIIVGATVGVTLRYYAIKAVKNFTKRVKTGKYSQCLLPQEIVEKLRVNPETKEIPETYLLNYRNGLGTFLGVMGGLFTNFAIDAPWSKKATNLIHENVFKKEKADGK